MNEIFNIKNLKYIGILIACIAITELVNSFTRKRYTEEMEQSITTLQQDVLKYRQQAVEIGIRDSIHNVYVKKELLKRDSIDAAIDKELHAQNRNNKIVKDAIKSIEDDLTKYGIDHSSLPEW